MLQFVVGWVQDFFNFSKVTEFRPLETVTLQSSQLTPSKKGYHFEHDELKRIMTRLQNFETVEFTDVSGTPMTPQSIDKRFGKDGGIDCVIHIVAPTERGAKNVATRIRNIIVNGDY
jgi:hypothetical protein